MQAANQLIHDITFNSLSNPVSNSGSDSELWQTSLRLVRRKIKDIKLEIEGLVESNADEYRQSISQAVDAVQLSRLLMHRVDSAAAQISGDEGLQARIDTVLSDIAASRSKLVELHSRHMSLSCFQTIKSRLDLHDDHMSHGRYLEATTTLVELEKMVHLESLTLEEDLSASIKKHFRLIQNGLHQMLEHAIHTAFVLSKTSSSITISMLDRVKFGSGIPDIFTNVAVDAAELAGLLPKFMMSFVERIRKYLIIPMAEATRPNEFFVTCIEKGNMDSAWNFVVSIQTSPTQTGSDITAKNNDIALNSSLKIYILFANFLSEFAAHLSLSSPATVELLSAIGNDTLLQFEVAAMKSLSLNNFPQNIEDFEAFSSHLMPIVQEFNESLQKLDIQCSLESPFHQFLSRIEERFVDQHSQNIIERARTLIFSQDYTTTVFGVSWKTDSENRSPFSIPQITIRQSTQSLVNILDKTLLSAMTLKSEGATLIYYTIRDILDIFRASHVVALYQTSNTDKIPPHLSMVLHNDCMFIAHWCLLAAATYQDKISLQQGCVLHFIDLVPPLHNLAHRYYYSQQQLQLKNILECIASSTGFDCLEPDRYAAVESAMNQTIYHIRHIASIYQKVLSDQVYLIAIGQLVSGMCQAIISEIEQLEDIAEDESVKLANLVQKLEGLSSMFIVDSSSIDSQIQLYTQPHYRKCIMVGALLKWNFAQIMEAFRAGKLKDFTLPEISKLIKSLFSDTPLRDRNLAEIYRGHPN
ncbi:hypothetical protein BDV3_005805 [Batrachochytrium dendrobatidis]